MRVIDVSVEENGIVIFDKSVLMNFYDGKINEGENLFKRYIETDEGEKVLEAGILVPILAIDDLGYDVIIKYDEEFCEEMNYVKFSNGVFPLEINDDAIISDLYSIMNWKSEISTDYDGVGISPGFYGVTVSGYRKNDDIGNIDKIGYIISFKKEAILPPLTGETGMPMRLLDL